MVIWNLDLEWKTRKWIWIALVMKILIHSSHVLSYANNNKTVQSKGRATSLYHQLNKINHKQCSIGRTKGICMFVWECMKTGGEHAGMCMDGFMFGSCCMHDDAQNSLDNNFVFTSSSSVYSPSIEKSSFDKITNSLISSNSYSPSPYSSSSSNSYSPSSSLNSYSPSSSSNSYSPSSSSNSHSPSSFSSSGSDMGNSSSFSSSGSDSYSPNVFSSSPDSSYSNRFSSSTKNGQNNDKYFTKYSTNKDNYSTKYSGNNEKYFSNYSANKDKYSSSSSSGHSPVINSNYSPDKSSNYGSSPVRPGSFYPPVKESVSSVFSVDSSSNSYYSDKEAYRPSYSGLSSSFGSYSTEKSYVEDKFGPYITGKPTEKPFYQPYITKSPYKPYTEDEYGLISLNSVADSIKYDSSPTNYDSESTIFAPNATKHDSESLGENAIPTAQKLTALAVFPSDSTHDIQTYRPDLGAYVTAYPILVQKKTTTKKYDRWTKPPKRKVKPPKAPTRPTRPPKPIRPYRPYHVYSSSNKIEKNIALKKITTTTTEKTTTTPKTTTTQKTTTQKPQKSTSKLILGIPEVGPFTTNVHSDHVCGMRRVGPQPQGRIVNGTNSRYGEFPWQTSVRRTSFFGFSSTHRCGGALLNSKWVATAGHCVDDLLLSHIRLRVGEYDFSTVSEPYPYVERKARKKVVHPKYNFFTYEYDLALVEMVEQVDFKPHIQPICLPGNQDLLIGENAKVTGWGRLSEHGSLPSILQQASVPIMSNAKCQKMFLDGGRKEDIPDIFLCAGYPYGGTDSCQGDSGGPMQVKGADGRWFLAGIISWGIGCAEPNLPGVCTRISKFVPFILEHVTR